MSGTKVQILEQERLLVFLSLRKLPGFQELSAGTGAETCVLSIILQSIPPAALPGIQGLGEIMFMSPKYALRSEKASHCIPHPRGVLFEICRVIDCICLALTRKALFKPLLT